MARMDAEQELALADARAEVARLHDEEKREQEQIIERRRDAEEHAWTEIDHMTDKNKDILADPDLVVRIGDKYYNWQVRLLSSSMTMREVASNPSSHGG